MRDILADVERWRARGEKIALATVVATWGSAPRREGAKMAITSGGEIAGSVSGGCVEGAVAEAGLEALQTGRARLLHFGVADETAWDVGLACGGSLDVLVEPLDPEHFAFTRELIQADRAVATATLIRGPEAWVGRKLSLDPAGGRPALGGLGPDLDEAVRKAAAEAVEDGRPRPFTVEDGPATPESGPLEIFIDVVPPAPTLVMVGGVHIAIALAALAKPMGYRTVVIDPRRAFGTQARFPHADRLIQEWPAEAFAAEPITPSTAVATLTHDPKIDDPALLIALRSPAFYVGALGSQQTQARRRRRLAEAGLSEAELSRLHGPIGIDLGGQTPEEIALAVMAQIVAVRHGREPAPA